MNFVSPKRNYAIDGFYAFGGNFAWMGLHLWYLLMLFVFSLLTLPFFVYIQREPRPAFISKFNSWLWLLAIIGNGLHHCNFNNKFLAYANEAVLPFYILHQTIIVTIAFYLIGIYLPVSIKYFIIASTSMLTILILYEAFIRRVNLIRFLFGLKPKT